VCFRNAEHLLGFEIHDSTKDVIGFRSIGGGIEDGETSRQAVEREVSEEPRRPITEPVLLVCSENIFTFMGRPGHEIVFVTKAAFVDRADYERESFQITEPNFESYPRSGGHWTISARDVSSSIRADLLEYSIAGRSRRPVVA